MAYKKKLIEVALPLEAINAECKREKSIRHGHPSTLHLWWARRPLAAARAVIWASLVDDPSSHPDKYPTVEAQQKERDRLFGILSRLVVWENSNNPDVLAEAKAEIKKSTGGSPLSLLDPFAGGGTIPLEAQRLGLKAYAHDLNPVAVMINKATIEIPPKFYHKSPVNPNARASISGNSWSGVAGLAEDVRYYGEWMLEKAKERIGYLYPTLKDSNGNEYNAIVWVWVRTIKCPNPACGCNMPLARSFVLSKNKGKEVFVNPVCNDDDIDYRIVHGKASVEGTVNRKGAHCIKCGSAVEFSYIRSEGKAGRMGSRMIAIIAEAKNGKEYFAANDEQIVASRVNKPEHYPDALIPDNPRDFKTPNYGLTHFSDLFTSRQLTTLTTFAELVKDAQVQIEKDAINAGLYNDHIPLSEGGKGARAYSEAVGVYLSFVVDREANYCSSQNGWSGDFVIQVFGRQAIPMVWDFVETNPFSNSTGNWLGAVNWVVLALRNFPGSSEGFADQHNAQEDCLIRNAVISTDPPYYDNIDYSDLSDYFYLWMRWAIRDTYPLLFKTLMVPKAEELIANPYRHEGDSGKAKTFFEDGILSACKNLYEYTSNVYPVTIYYAFKQSETEITEEGERTASKGWETMLSAIIKAGFIISGTWPMHTERETGLKSSMNALASSIVLVCRKRPDTAGSVTRRDFINALHREMVPALEKLQSVNIAPVDLAQSAIGPGIGVFSRYDSVIENDGSPMSVRSALQIINEELDAFYNEQEGELDAKSRFCVDLFTQFAFNNMKYGEAEVLARAKNTSVDALVNEGVMESAKKVVRLKTREEIPEKIDANEDCCWKITQQLARAMERGGVKKCAEVLCEVKGYIAENAKALAYRLYTICERKNWAAEGYAYNNMIVAWPDILSEAAAIKAVKPEQLSMLDQL